MEASCTIGRTTHATAHRCTPAKSWRACGIVATRTPADTIVLHDGAIATHYVTLGNSRVPVADLHRALLRAPGVTSATVFVVPDAHGIARAYARVATNALLTATAVASVCAAVGTPINAKSVTVDRPP